MKRISWKAAFVFCLAVIVIIAIIIYGLWLPNTLDFTSMT